MTDHLTQMKYWIYVSRLIMEEILEHLEKLNDYLRACI